MGIMLETRLRAAARARAWRTTTRPTRCRRAGCARSRWPASSASRSPPGILIGIGETPRERVDALVAIRDLHERYGHIQEVIVQNFRAKPRIPMRDAPEPSARRPAAHARGGAARARPRHEHPGAAEPVAGRLPAAAGRRPQRLGRHLAAHARPHQPREAVAADPASCARRPRARASTCASAWRSIPSSRRAPSSSTSGCARGSAALIDERRPRQGSPMSTGDAGSLLASLDWVSRDVRRDPRPRPRRRTRSRSRTA